MSGAEKLTIKWEDFENVVRALCKMGYKVLCWSDPESCEDTEDACVVIEYVHPEWEGDDFVLSSEVRGDYDDDE